MDFFNGFVVNGNLLDDEGGFLRAKRVMDKK
jgi:hypothetical protein